MTRDKPPHPRPTGHVIVPAAAIGGLSIILVLGLELLKVLDRLNSGIARLVSQGETVFPKHMPGWCLWLAVVCLPLLLAAAILGTPGNCKRLILWITAMVVISAWAPVLHLAAHAPDIGAPWIATLWAGICSLVYSNNHRMPCDESPTRSHEPR